MPKGKPNPKTEAAPVDEYTVNWHDKRWQDGEWCVSADIDREDSSVQATARIEGPKDMDEDDLKAKLAEAFPA